MRTSKPNLRPKAAAKPKPKPANPPPPPPPSPSPGPSTPSIPDSGARSRDPPSPPTQAQSPQDQPNPSGPGSEERRPSQGARLPPDNLPPDGPAFILLKRRDGLKLSGNPFAIQRSLVALCGEVDTAKAIQSGALLVKTKSQQQNITLLGTTAFLGHEVAAEVAVRLTSCEGLIRCPDLGELSEDEILQELAPQGVIEVVRLRSKDNTPNPLLRLRFRGFSRPDRIFCGYLSVPVREWVPSPRQCRKCWRFGHTDRVCHSRQPTCGRCASAHATEDCTSSTLSCISCGEPHAAWDRDCLSRRAAREAQARRARASQPHPPAPSPGSDVWLELVPQTPRRHQSPSTRETSPRSPPSPTATEPDTASVATQSSRPELN